MPGLGQVKEMESLAHLTRLLVELVREYGQHVTAAGVFYRTLRRAIHAQRLGPKLRIALERYRLLLQGADAPNSTLLVRLSDLERRVPTVEGQVRLMASAVERLNALVPRIDVFDGAAGGQWQLPD